MIRIRLVSIRALTAGEAPSAAVSKMIERCSTIRRRAYAVAP